VTQALRMKEFRLSEFMKEVDRIVLAGPGPGDRVCPWCSPQRTDLIDGFARARLHLAALQRMQHVVSGRRPARIEGCGGLERPHCSRSRQVRADVVTIDLQEDAYSIVELTELVLCLARHLTNRPSP
jgi:hypothetical protein